MSWSSRRKLKIIGIILIVPFIIIVIIAIRLLSVQPTCFDGKQNGLELGVDCGGACSRLCLSQVNNVAVLWARPFWVADDVYNVVAYFENQNVNAGIRDIIYEFTLYDQNNRQIGEPFKGATFIGPNERSAIFASRIKTGGVVAQTAIFRFLEQPLWEKTNPEFARPLLTVKNQQLTGVDTQPRLNVTLQNSTLNDITSTDVVAILYDASGNALASSQTHVPVVERTSTKDIFFVWPQPISAPVSRVEIIPRVNPFVHADFL